MAGKARHEWQLNIWTGDHILEVDDNTRVLRLAGGGLYRKEFWGDYGRGFPHRGPWEATLKKALESALRVDAWGDPLPGANSAGEQLDMWA